MDVNQFLTLETLKTFPGLVAVTWALVQFSKSFLDQRLFKIKTKWYVFVVAEVLLFCTAWLDNSLNPQTVFLNLLNGFMVALAAMKGHETIFGAANNKPAK